MDRQLSLPLGTPEERGEAARRYVTRLGWSDREVAALVVMAAHGEVIELADQEIWQLSTSVANAARQAGCAKATWLAGVAHLVGRKLMTVIKGRPQTYVVNWSRVVELLEGGTGEPAAQSQLAAQISDLLSPDWEAGDGQRRSATVSDGQRRSATVRQRSGNGQRRSGNGQRRSASTPGEPGGETPNNVTSERKTSIYGQTSKELTGSMGAGVDPRDGRALDELVPQVLMRRARAIAEYDAEATPARQRARIIAKLTAVSPNLDEWFRRYVASQILCGRIEGQDLDHVVEQMRRKDVAARSGLTAPIANRARYFRFLVRKLPGWVEPRRRSTQAPT